MEMLAEIGDEVRYGIDTRICVGKDKADNPQRVPEVIVVVFRVGVKVEPHEEDVNR